MNQSLHPLIMTLLLVLSGTSVANTNDTPDTGHAESEEIISPETIDGVVNVDADGLIEKVMEITKLVLIDSRITADRKEGYIEGSVSLPDIDTTCGTLATALGPTSTPALFYCNGVKCGRSAKAAQIAIDCGYTEIYWYRNGMEEWQQKQYPLVQ